MSYAISNCLNSQFLGATDGFLPRVAVSHDARQFENLGDPAAIIFTVQLNRQLHRASIPLSGRPLVRLSLLS